MTEGERQPDVVGVLGFERCRYRDARSYRCRREAGHPPPHDYESQT